MRKVKIPVAIVCAGMLLASSPVVANAKVIEEDSKQSVDNLDYGAGEGSEHPDKMYAPYVDMGNYVNFEEYGGAPDLVSYSEGQGAMYYNLGFIQATGGVDDDGSLNWGWAGIEELGEGSESAQYLGISQSIADFRATGGDVIVSFGEQVDKHFGWKLKM